MKSAVPGPSTSPVEVANVTRRGFWLLVGQRELFVAFRDFPWFKDASIGQITKVELPSPHHLYWPELDVDLAVESIEHPEKYPLVSQARPDRRLRPASTPKRTRGKPGRPGARTRLNC
jgi:hypothetical protein